MTLMHDRGILQMDERAGTPEMTNEEYRERIIEIFKRMDSTYKLQFWYNYIKTIERGEG